MSSEYTLYGRFVRDVLGASGGQFVSCVSPLLCDLLQRAPRSRWPQLDDDYSELDRIGRGADASRVSLTAKAVP